MKVRYACLMLTLPFILTGCCSTYVRHMGTSQVWIQPVSIAKDDKGDVLFTVALSRKSLSPPYASSDIGKRHVLLNSPHAEAALREILERRAGKSLVLYEQEKKFLQVQVRVTTLPKTEQEASETDAWYIWPADVLKKIDEPGLPSHVITNSFSVPNCKNDGSGLALPWEIEGTTYQAHFFMPSPELYSQAELGRSLALSPEAVHTAKWAPPVRAVLIVPAFLVDIVTCPIQAIWQVVVIVNESKSW